MNRLKHTNAGFTLVELVIVILIIGILSAIAVPSYRGYVLRATRADAKKALLARAADLERCFTRNNSYLNNPAGSCLVVGNLPDGSSTTYRVEADPDGVNGGTGGITATTFAIRAVPINGQAADTKCGTFKVDDKNSRAVTGTLAATPRDCWGR